MDLNFGKKYKDFTKEVKDFCKKYKGIHFIDSSKVPLPEEKSQAIAYLLASSSPKINGEQLTISD